jgi:hypothetical protein
VTREYFDLKQWYTSLRKLTDAIFAQEFDGVVSVGVDAGALWVFYHDGALSD